MSMLRTSPVRVLDDRDLDAARALCRRDPVADVFTAARIEAVGLEPQRLGAEVWGHSTDGRLDALCYVGATIAPVQASAAAARAFAERARRTTRRCSSLNGPADAVLGMWRLLEGAWGPARELRPDQPLLVIDGDPLVEPDPLVRPVVPAELDILLPASIAMFTEEVGVSPTALDGGALYRARVGELVHAGRAWARIEDGRVVFKAEVGAATGLACQVQGVWVEPSLRGQGLAAAGTAAVVLAARERIASRVSLYVNGFNTPARAAYARVGFRQVGTFASVLF